MSTTPTSSTNPAGATAATGADAAAARGRRPHTVRPDRRASRVEGRAADLSVVLLALGIATLLLVGSFTMEVRGQQVPGPTFFPLIVSGLLYAMGVILLVMVLRPSHRPEDVDVNPNISREMIRDLTGITESGPRAFVESVRHPRGSTAAGAAVPSGAAATDAAGETVTDAAATDAAGETEIEAAEDPDTAYPLDWRTVLLTVGAVVVFIAGLNVLGWIISAALLFWIIAYAFGSKRPILDIGIALLFSSLIQLLFAGALGLSLPAGFVGGLF